MLRRGLLLLALAVVPAGAQQQQPRFTTQVLLVPAFAGSDGATVSDAAEAAARDLIAARRQIPGLRRCENLARDAKPADAIAAAAQGVVAYAKAVPARLCMLGAMLKLDSPPFDSVAAVAQA